MKKIFTAILLSVFLLTWFGPMPSALALDRSGDEFNILIGTPVTFQAGEPFHFAHGWLLDPSTHHPVRQFDFYLELDGVMQTEDFMERSGSGGNLLFFKVFNYPDGLPAGTYTFTGYWVGPCKSLVENGLYPGPCANPVEQVTASTLSLTVEFLP